MVSVLDPNTDWVLGVAFSRIDSRTLVSASRDNVIKVWDLSAFMQGRPSSRQQLDDSRTPNHLLHRIDDDFSCFALSADGLTIAAGGANSGEIKLWHTNNGKLRHVLRGHRGHLLCV